MLSSDEALELAIGALSAQQSGAVIQRLSGGVSALVFRVTFADRPSVVLKQSRPVLDVPGFWPADPRRSAFEAAALQVMGEMTSDRVPRVLAVDNERHVLIMEAAPESWVNYKSALLEGDAEPHVAGLVAEALATWHGQTLGSTSVKDGFLRLTDLEDLRIHPWFGAAAEDEPALEPLMNRATSILRQPGRCLVHGDATPKNVLSSPGGNAAWLLDPEVAHFGSPEFDVAMWCSHLLLKMHRVSEPTSAANAGAALAVFAAAYREGAPDGLVVDEALRTLLAAVTEGRLHGLSRVEYIDTIDRARLFDTTTRILVEPGSALGLLHDMGEAAA
jgi:5-methylthioribose kinase